MSSYSELANTIIQQKGAGGKYSGLNTSLDVMQAFKDAQLKYQMASQLKSQENDSEARKGIAQAGLMSGVTPDAATAYQQYLNPGSQPSGAASMATGGSLPNGQQKLYGKAGVAQEQKNATLDLREENMQNRIEDQTLTRLKTILTGSQGDMGIQNKKVSTAFHARELLNQSYDPNTRTYHVSEPMYNELSQTLTTLLSGTNITSDARTAGLMQKTGARDLAGLVAYVKAKPTDALSQEIAANLRDMIDRQGLTSEYLRNNAVSKSKFWINSGLKDDRKTRIFDGLQGEGLFNSYSDLLKTSPDYQNDTAIQKNLDAFAESLVKTSGKQPSLAMNNSAKETQSNKVGKYTFQ